MTAVVQRERYYTAPQVRLLCMLYPYLADSQPPSDPELAGIAAQVFGPGGWREEAMSKRADIKRAIEWLQARDERAAYCVRANVVVGLPLRAVAAYLCRLEEDGHTYNHETISRWVSDGITLMAAFLEGDIVRDAMPLA